MASENSAGSWETNNPILPLEIDLGGPAKLCYSRRGCYLNFQGPKAGTSMYRKAAFLLCLVAGCSTAPVADLLDFFRPGQLGQERTPPYGGVCAPAPVGSPAGGAPLPVVGSPVPAPAPISPGGPAPVPPNPSPPPPGAPPASPSPLAPGTGTSGTVIPLPPATFPPSAGGLTPATGTDGPPISAPAPGIAPDIGGPR
jgi:hypothetical protein